MGEIFKHFRPAGFLTDLKTSQCKFDNPQRATQLKLKTILDEDVEWGDVAYHGQ